MGDENHTVSMELMHELLKRMAFTLDRLEKGQKDIQSQLNILRHTQIAHSADSLRHDEKFAEIETRLERLESYAHFVDT